jgi:hypothetical protein
MATVRDVVEMGLRKIGVVDPNGDEIAGAVAAFSAMVSGWKLQGIDIWHAPEAYGDGFPVPEIDYSDFAASDEFPMPDAFREAAAYCLAEKVAPEYGKGMDASGYLRQIQAGYALDTRTKMDPILSASRARRLPVRWF